MFTGIVQAVGTVKAVSRTHTGSHMTIASSLFVGVAVGESIAVNGICLTAVSVRPGEASFDVIRQTLSLTSLQQVTRGRKVNLEKALKAGDSISGHLVLGHIDCLGVVRSARASAATRSVEIEVPSAFAPLLVDKGSVALDGVSLTIASLRGSRFTVAIIPHTWNSTIVGHVRVNDRVNIEFDQAVKQARRLPGEGAPGKISEDLLKSNGFV